MSARTPRPTSVDLLLEAFRQRSPRRLAGLAASGVRLDATDADGRTCLHLAAARGEATTVEWILEAGADPATPTRGAGADGTLPLHHAARAGCPRTCGVLLGAGADVDGIDTAGGTPLAGARGPDVVRLLVDSGADPDRPALDGRTPRDRLPAGSLDRPAVTVWMEDVESPRRGRTRGPTPVPPLIALGIEASRRGNAAVLSAVDLPAAGWVVDLPAGSAWARAVPFGGATAPVGGWDRFARRHLRVDGGRATLFEPGRRPRLASALAVLGDGVPGSHSARGSRRWILPDPYTPRP